jgi:hypothetical protein
MMGLKLDKSQPEYGKGGNRPISGLWPGHLGAAK